MSEELLPLTGKQPLFCLMYVSDANFNATRAAELAGYAGDRWTLASVGSENLQKPHIKAEIERLMTVHAMGAQEALARLAMQARGAGDYIQPDGRVDIGKLVRDGKGHLVKKVRETVTRKAGTKDEELVHRSIEFCDPQRALEMIGKNLQLFTDSIDLTTKGEKLDAGTPNLAAMGGLVALYEAVRAGGAAPTPAPTDGGDVAAHPVRAAGSGVPE